ncbi:MAG: hypothetical protein IPI93_02170 [Sphingobacteriaceae bacterium]|nr:hypothetical protein [Sphingobacteriaceae bacterium]
MIARTLPCKTHIMETTSFIKLGNYTLSCDLIKKAVYSIYDLSNEIKQLTIKSIPVNASCGQLLILIELCSKNLCNCVMEKQVFYEFIRALKKEGQYYREFFKELETEFFPQIKLVYKPEGSL